MEKKKKKGSALFLLFTGDTIEQESVEKVRERDILGLKSQFLSQFTYLFRPN